jgi:capsular exopolysaccharide synthesis family protein
MDAAAPSTLTDYLGVVRRRWWIALLVIALATGSALLVSRLETPKYQASAEVRLANQPLAGLLKQQSNTTTAERYAATQAQLAATAPVARLALKKAKVKDITPQQLLSRSTITASATSDFLDFSVTDRSSDRAKRLATSYARAYADWSNKSVFKQITQALTPLRAQARKLGAQVRAAAGFQADLVARYHQALGTIADLELARQQQRNSTQVAQVADSATKVSPKVTRNVLLGLGLGVFFGLALMSLIEALDRRVRDSDEIQRRLGLHLLGRIPTPPRDLRKPGQLGLLSDDAGHFAEVFHRLRVSLDFANVKTRARTLMVTSAVEQEGKSSTAGNLALAMAGAGRRVALVDLDLRRPMIATFFGLPDRVGATSVMLAGVAGPSDGSLLVMTAGPLPPNPSPLLEADATTELLDEIADRVDIVIIDSAPMLPVSDSVVLGGKVEGVVVVVRSEVVTRPMLTELHRTLLELPTPKLGFVLTGSEHDAGGYGYGGGYGYSATPQSQESFNAQSEETATRPTSPAPMSQLRPGEPKFDQT